MRCTCESSRARNWRSTVAKVSAATASPDAPIPLDPAHDPDTRALTGYLQDAIADLAGPVEYFRFTGGHANLTFLVKSPLREYVLKREPGGMKARSAHDMRREFHMLSRLAPVYRFAPKPVLLCEDESVFGGVFCVMERLTGEIVRARDGAGVGADLMTRRLLALIDALADLHVVDVAAARLLDFGKPQGYRARQVEGWCKRFRQASIAETASAEDVMEWLQGSIPPTQQSAAIVHNDFKMDNLVWDNRAPEALAGVLDWEMATVGDPLMDLACTLSFWSEQTDPGPLRALRSMPSDYPEAPTRQEALRRYASRTGVQVEDFVFYRCFGLFRRAVIEQQKFHRWVTGQTSDPRYAKLDQAVHILLESCRQLVKRAST
jgi:aminoglycoside phosphotransferase (APT) family kinase protein